MYRHRHPDHFHCDVSRLAAGIFSRMHHATFLCSCQSASAVFLFWSSGAKPSRWQGSRSSVPRAFLTGWYFESTQAPYHQHALRRAHLTSLSRWSSRCDPQPRGTGP